MNFHRITVLLVAACAQESLSFSGPGPGPQNAFGQTQIVGRRASPKVPAPQEKPTDDSTASPSPEDETVDAFIRKEYEAWVIQYNKTADDERYAIFKGNFLATLQAYETTGKYSALNKFADLTEAEYKKEPAPADELEVYIKSEYKAWLEQYGKSPSEKKFAIFRTNFLETMKHFEKTGQFKALNEHADMTREEYLRLQTKLAMSSAKQSQSGAGNDQAWRGDPYAGAGQQSTQSYSRTSAMTFISVTPSAQSDILNNGSKSGGSGNEWSSSDWGAPSYAPPSMSSSPAMYGGFSSTSNEWSGQEFTSPMMGPPPPSTMQNPYSSSYSNSPPDPYASNQYSRPSGATFTPITPRSSSDVLNNNPSPSPGDWSGTSENWGFDRSNSPSPQPYVPSNPSGVNFKPISQNSSSDIRNRGSSGQNRNKNDFSGSGSSPYSPSYSSMNNPGKGAFSYMPKSNSSPNDKNGENSNGGGSTRASTKNLSPMDGSKNDSIWDKMASAVGAIAGGSKPNPASSFTPPREIKSNGMPDQMEGFGGFGDPNREGGRFPY